MSSATLSKEQENMENKGLTKFCIIALFGCALLTGLLPKSLIAAAAVCVCVVFATTKHMYLAFPIMLFYYESFGIFMGMSVYRYYSLLFLFVTVLHLKNFEFYALQMVSAVIIAFYCIALVAPDDLRRAVFVIVDMVCVLFLVNHHLTDREKLEKFFKVYALIALCTYVTGLVVNQTRVFDRYVDGKVVQIVRSNTTFEDPNYAGFFMTIAVFAVVVLKLFSPKIRWLIVAGLYAIILTTISMTAIIVNVALWMVYLLFTKKSNIKMIIAVVLIFALLFGLYSYGEAHPDTPVLGSMSFRISEKLEALEEGDMGSVTTNRSDLSQRHIDYFKEQSIFKMLIGLNQASTIKSNIGGLRGVAHNEYIDLLLNIGILGTIMMLLYVLKRTIDVIKNFKETEDRRSLLIFMVKLVWLLYGFSLTMFGDYRFMFALFM